MIEDLLSFGKRHLLCGDVPQAVEYLQKACETIATEYGDLDPSLAEPNLLYGTALLELSRMENTVIGNALNGEATLKILQEASDASEGSQSDKDFVEDTPEMTDEQKEELSRKVIDAMCEDRDEAEEVVSDTVEESVKKTDAEQESVEKTEVEQKSIDKIDIELKTAGKTDADVSDDKDAADENSESSEDEDENENEDEKTGTDDDEVTNLQLAWEVIEVAKQIFSKSNDKKSRLKVADCLGKLAEISREKEDYVQAISDLQECLRIQTEALNGLGREIAETFFQMGTTYSVAGDDALASEAFRKSARSLQSYVDSMNEKIAKMKENEESEDAIKKAYIAMKDVRDLIPDVERRYADAQEDHLNRQTGLSVIEQATRPSCSASLLNGSAQPADDISHLVRKKRTVDQVVSETPGGVEGSVSQNAEPQQEAKKSKVVDANVDESNLVNGGPKIND